MIKGIAVSAALFFFVCVGANASDDKDNLLSGMMADLATYESCARSSARGYLSSGAAATEIAVAADRDCAIYYRNYNDRLQRLAGTPGLSSEEVDGLLNRYQSLAESHRDGIRRDIIAETVSAKSKQ